MTNPIPYRRVPTGSISGFTEIALDGSTTTEPLEPAEFSLAQVIQRLNAIRSDLNPSSLFAIETLIQHHIQDRNNPHHVVLSDVVVDVVREVLRPQLPGTSPGCYPTYSIMAELLDIGEVCTVERATPITVVDPTGYLVTKPANTVAIDHSQGEALIPLWLERMNHISNSNVKTTGEAWALNTTRSTETISGIKAPDRSEDYVSFKDGLSTGLHGYEIITTIVGGTRYTDHLCIYPLTHTGYIHLTVESYPDDYVTLDLVNKTLSTSSGVIGYVTYLKNGWIRLGIEYSGVRDESSTTKVLYTPTPGILPYTGNNNTLFCVYNIQHDDRPGLGPVIDTSKYPATLSATTLSFPLRSTCRPSEGMVSTTFRTGVLPSTSTPFLSINDLLSLEIADKVKTIVLPKSTDPALYTDSLLPHTEYNQAISYSDKVVVKRMTGSDRQVRSDLYLSGSPTTLTITSMDGYFKALCLYPQHDTDRALEFLIGEDL